MSRSAARLSACALVAASTALWSGAVAPAAYADDALEEQLAAVSALADADVPAEPAAAPTAIASEPGPEDAPAADPQIEEPPVAAAMEEVAEDTALDASAPVDEPAGEGSAAVEPAPQPVAPSDTTVDSGDIAPDTPEAEVEPASPPVTAPATEPQAPPPVAANVNVSVRIDSPGDNGSVSQLNVAASSPATVPPVAETPSTSPTTRSTTTVSPTTGSTGTGSAASPGDAPGSGWYWEWDCLSAPPISAISPARSTDGSIPLSWTWIWNCNGNSDQYQTQISGRYQQTNTNVSIRIASPGDDGSVTQVNVSVGTASGQTTPSRPGSAPAPPGSTLPLPLPPAIVAMLAPVLGVATTPFAPSAAVVISPPQDVAVPLLDLGSAGIGEPSAAVHGPYHTVAGLPLGADARSRTSGTGAGAWVPAAPIAGSRPGPARLWVAETIVRPAPPPTTGAESGRAGEAVRGTAPRWRPASPGSLLPPRTSGTSAAAASGGGSSGGGGLPFILALPFVAAVLDLARRVALERATWPPGHRRRMPDTPG